VCCATAIKNALTLKDKNPDAQIVILYRDIRTYGLMEPYYREARQRGVLFARYHPEEKPEVAIKDGRLSIQFFEPVIKRKITIFPDSLVLSTATIPRENEELALMLKVPRMADGFFLEAHMKLRPVDFATDGIYVCGTAHSPKNISESIAQAAAAAARAGTILALDHISVGGVVAVVDEERCAACLTCVRACPYSVPVINERGKAEIDPVKCHGCGVCAAECPGKAIQLQYFRDVQVIAKCDALYDEKEVAA
jgi:heterodisulfide reductase subunit A-like polyferredoxin